MSATKKVKRDEMLMSERRKLAAKMVELMDWIGGRLVRPYDYEVNGPTDYEYEVCTPLGILRACFTTADVHFHCRFDDVDRANTVMNPDKCLGGIMNPFSGKYNTYAFGRFTAQEAMERVFVPHLQFIWRRCGQTAPWIKTLEAA